MGGVIDLRRGHEHTRPRPHEVEVRLEGRAAHGVVLVPCYPAHIEADPGHPDHGEALDQLGALLERGGVTARGPGHGGVLEEDQGDVPGVTKLDKMAPLLSVSGRDRSSVGQES